MEKNQAAVALGKLGGSVTSRRKAAAAKRNAKLGGWPKGRKRGKRVGPAYQRSGSNATGPTRKSKDPNVIAHGVVARAEALTQQASARRFPEAK